MMDALDRYRDFDEQCDVDDILEKRAQVVGKIKVNRIAVNVNVAEDTTDVTLYKNNTPLGFIPEDSLEIPTFSNSGVSLKAYQLYCKDIVENLLENGGIPGFYYEPKEEPTGEKSEPIKYDVSEFRKKTAEYIKKVLGDDYEFTMTDEDNRINIEQYADMFIKNARIDFGVTIKEPRISLMICGEIKSGQMCRPRMMIYNGQEMKFNITNVNKISKGKI